VNRETPAPAIRAVLFDFGGVILSSPFDAFTRFEQAHGLPEGFLRAVNARHPHTNAWARLERGEIDVAEFGACFAAEALELGHEVDGREVLSLLGGEVRAEMVEVVRRCRTRFITGLLTNNFLSDPELLGERFGARAQEIDDALSLFDFVIESSKVGIRKPEQRFYELACQTIGIEPAEAVFLDDLGMNLKPARAMGMSTIKVESPAQATRELEELLGIVLS
jgi:putative hydrolase of the HAD superfamily